MSAHPKTRSSSASIGGTHTSTPIVAGEGRRRHKRQRMDADEGSDVENQGAVLVVNRKKPAAHTLSCKGLAMVPPTATTTTTAAAAASSWDLTVCGPSSVCPGFPPDISISPPPTVN